MNNNTNQENRRGFLSKMLVMGASGVALLSSSALASNQNNGSSKLTEEQKDELYFIYQEEKVARDVYIYANGVYPEAGTFASIKGSEQRHIDAAEKLCINYGIDLSAVDESAHGEFDHDYLQGLYDSCIDTIDKGGILEAQGVGKLIEETDIGTLTNAIELMEMPDDVIRTYEVLREGSYNHLESFDAAIAIEELR